jgi:hypothetical protein
MNATQDAVVKTAQARSKVIRGSGFVAKSIRATPGVSSQDFRNQTNPYLAPSGGSKTDSSNSMLIGEYRPVRENASLEWMGQFLLVRVGKESNTGE